MCHRLAECVSFENVNLCFLPPNSTSLVQPLDMGGIRSFKSKYTNLVARKRLALIDEGYTQTHEIDKQITVKVALEFSKAALIGVTEGTIANCFRKAWGENLFGECVEEEAADTPQEPDTDEEEELPCYGEASDEDIIAFVRGEEDEEGGAEEGQSAEQEVEAPPQKREAFAALNTIRRYLESIGENTEAAETLEVQLLETYDRERVQEEIVRLYPA